MKEKFRKYFQLIFFSFLFLGCLWLSLVFHRVTGNFNYRSEIWADRAGYYMYLPATFFYHFEYDKFPEHIDEKTGYGFTMNPETRTFETRYTYGVALLISPFFLAARAVAALFGFNPVGGFSMLFHRMVDFAGAFYMVLGLFLLFRVLLRFFKPVISYLVVFFIFTGSNLFYYGIRDPLMSHVYSFFLFSLFLWALHQYLDNRKFGYFILLGAAAAMATLIRPTNILIYGLLFLWNVGTFEAFRTRLKEILTLKKILTLGILLVLVFMPQLMYWKYVSGNYLYYSYHEQTFSNWNHPKVLEVWFSTLNGLFIYNPLYLVLCAGIVYAIISRKSNGILSGVYFLAVTYLCAAWFAWYFGCSYGQRPFVDYLPVFAIPFGFLANRIWESSREIPRGIFLGLLLVMSYYSIRMTEHWDQCFFGSIWDWNQFAVQAERSGVWKRTTGEVFYLNDFENTALADGSLITGVVSWSGSSSGQLDPDHQFCGKFWKHQWDGFGALPPETADITIRVYNPSDSATGGQVVCAIETNDTVISYQSSGLDVDGVKPGTWYEVKKRFQLPPMTGADDRVTVYIWNPKKALFYVDDLKAVFH